MRVKEESEEDSLKLNIQKTKIMAPGPIMANRRGKSGNWQTLFSGLQNYPQTVTVAKKLKDTCSLEEKLWQT